jgi:hypothetical protein
MPHREKLKKVLQIGLNQRLDLHGSIVDSMKQFLIGILDWHPQDIAVASPDPLCWQPPEFAAQGRNIPVSYFFGQTQVLERQNQIVSPQDHLHIGCIGPKTPGWNLGHEKGIFELSNEKFLVGPVRIKSPDVLGFDHKVVNQYSVVGVLFENEKSFLEFFWFQNAGPSHHSKTMIFFPVERGIGKLGSLPSLGELVVFGCYHCPDQWTCHSSDRDVPIPFLLDRHKDIFVVECPIQSQTSPAGGYRGRKFVQYLPQKDQGSGRSIYISRPELYTQTQACFAFAGKNGSVGSLPSVFSVEADFGGLLPSEDSQGRSIAIYHGAIEETQTPEHFGTEFVVGCLQVLKALLVETPQESSQCIAMGKFWQAQERRDEPIVDKRLGVFDATDTRDNCKDVCQEEIDWVIAAMMVIWPMNLMLQKVSESQKFVKLCKNDKSSPAGETCFLEEKMEFSQAFWHIPQVYQNNTFVEMGFY